jgi:hypothetical protein
MLEGQGLGFGWQIEEGKLNCLHLTRQRTSGINGATDHELDGNLPQPISVMSLGPA